MAAAHPINDYEALDIIGNGSFGIIRKVKRKTDGALLARKELNFERMSERDRKQIVSEVNILKDLHHESIVRYHDRFVDREKGILYIMMEYCGGGDLGSIIKQCARTGTSIPEDTIWSYFLQLLQALHYCHTGGPRHPSSSDPSGTASRGQILHRDLKPENVFIDFNNRIKLGDFGLSKALGAACLANTYVGTPYYMSPELIQERSYDSKSDIWSLGCLIFELCALKPPFHEAQTHQELAVFIRSGRIPPLPRNYSQALVLVIKSMLNINPNLRPSAAQLLQHERIEVALKVTELEQKAAELASFKQLIATKEAELVSRENELRQKELSFDERVRAKEAELNTMMANKEEFLRNMMKTEEDRVRAQFVDWENTIRQEQTNREANVAKLHQAREQELEIQWHKRETELTKNVAEREEACQRQEEALRRAWEELTAQAAPEGPTREGPFKDIQNQPHLAIPSTISHDITPTRVPLVSARQKNSIARLQTPLTRLADKFRSARQQDPGSAMKGVILTSTGEMLDTPSPPIKGDLADLLGDSPIKGLRNFSDLDLASDSENEDASSPEKENRYPSAGSANTSPTIPPSRLRKPSLRNLTIRPSLPQSSASCPSHTLPTSISPVSTSRPLSQPSLERGDSDEENQPSPTVTRVEREPRIGFRPVSRLQSQSTALRAVAAANSAS
ncbi:kinase-like protein, partial [Sistotremastrum suecicum HHB10207 ss-3]